MSKKKVFSILGLVVYFAIFPFIFGSAESSDPAVVSKSKIEVVISKEETSGNEIFKILEDKYLVSALYYSDNFFEKIKEDKSGLNFQSKIVLGLFSGVTDELRNKYILGLMSLFPKEKISEKSNLVSPLDHYRVGMGRNSHQDAIDLFTLEGRTVKSMSYGIVVLSEQDWLPDEPDRTVSNNGGNQVIVFSPHTKSFYRYCHLDEINVETGDIIEAGKIIGTVGHSGLIASQYGHGEHLHLEINQYKGHNVICFSQRRLAEMLRSIKKK